MEDDRIKLLLSPNVGTQETEGLNMSFASRAIDASTFDKFGRAKLVGMAMTQEARKKTNQMLLARNVPISLQTE